jgi:hypothetical protein
MRKPHPANMLLALAAAICCALGSMAAAPARSQPQATGLGGRTYHGPAHDRPQDVRPLPGPDRPSIEVVVPIEPIGSGRCADPSRHKSQARVAGLGTFELQTSDEIPPADLGC